MINLQVKVNIVFDYQGLKFVFKDCFITEKGVTKLCPFDYNQKFAMGQHIDIKISNTYEFGSFDLKASFSEECSVGEHIWGLTFIDVEGTLLEQLRGLITRFGSPVLFYNKRKFPRIPHLGIDKVFPTNTLFAQEEGKTSSEFECDLEDLSIGGLCVNTTNPNYSHIPVNTVLIFSLKNVSKVRDISFKGRVMRINKTSPKPNQILTSFGLRFVDLSEDDQKILLKMIEVILVNLKK